MSYIGRFAAGSGADPIETLTGNTGGPVPPTGFNINVVGTGVITVVGNPATSTLTITPSGAIASSFPTDSGTATPVLGVLNILGGTGIGTTGAGNTVTINLDVPVTIANGGTNATSMANTFGVNYFDGTRIVTTAVGTAGNVLTSNGPGVAPSYQVLPSSSITISGDTGGPLVGSSFTFTGGTTGLSFGGAGSTETLTFAGITANGGTVSLATDATASTINIGTGAGAKTSTFGSTNTTSSTIIKSGSGNIAMNSGLTVDSTGRMTNSVQPCFLASQTTDQTDVTGDGTDYTVTFTDEKFDQNNNFDGTSTFTAPKTGRYLFNVTLLMGGILVTHTSITLAVLVSGTSAGRYRMLQVSPFSISVSGVYGVTGSVIANMTASDTAVVKLQASNGTKVVDIFGETSAGGGVITPAFGGFLIC